MSCPSKLTREDFKADTSRPFNLTDKCVHPLCPLLVHQHPSEKNNDINHQFNNNGMIIELILLYYSLFSYSQKN